MMMNPRIVAIPYKSGKYSYVNNLIVKSLGTLGVAIPYKSGKYSYIGIEWSGK